MKPQTGTVALRPSPANDPFHAALIKHLTRLKPAEREAFLVAYKTLSPEALVDQVKAFDQHHGDGGKIVRRFEPTVSRCFSVLEEILRSTAIAIQSSPEISSLVVGGARLLIDIAVKALTFFPKLAAMIESLTRYLEVLRSVVVSLHQDAVIDTNLIYKCAVDIYGDWLDFCRATRAVFVDKKGDPRRWITLRSFLRSQWDPFESAFGNIERSFQQHIDLLLHSEVASQSIEVKELLTLYRDDRQQHDRTEAMRTRTDFMRWIAKVDYEEDHERISAKRHPGTGDWLLERQEFQTWMDSTASRLLWCYGKPGCGKTVLASHTLEHVTARAALNDDVGIVFYYFNYKQADSQRPRDILSAFIKQLCWKRPILPDRVVHFYQKHLLDARTPSLDAVKDTLSTLAEDFQELYLVIDALDECQIEYRQDVLDAIVALTSDHDCARAFITSRRENDIAQMFQMLQAPAIVIKAKNTATDISKYVKDSVNELVNTKKLRIENPQTQERILERLVEGADGMFLWVFLQLQNLTRQRSDRDILSELERLPKDLWSTYDRILYVIEDLPEALQALAQRSLTIVFFAARPLRMKELIDLAAVVAGFDKMQRLDLINSRYQPEDVLEACANLLVVDEDEVVRPSHFSVQEFFSSPNHTYDARFSKYFMSPEQGHSQIAIACLRYLSIHFLRGGVCGTEFSMKMRLSQYPCSRYAAQHFDYHAVETEQPSPELYSTLKLFLDQPARCYESLLQMRRLTRGPYEGLQPGELLDLTWPVNARTMVAATKLYRVPGLFSEEDEAPAFQAFLQACFDGLADVVDYLLSEGWDPTRSLGEWKSPLEYATERGNEEVCRRLVDSEHLFNKRNYLNALRTAFASSQIAMVRILLSGLKKADIEQAQLTDNEMDLTSQWNLLSSDALDLAKLLLTNVSLNATNWETIVDLAFSSEDEILIRSLLCNEFPGTRQTSQCDKLLSYTVGGQKSPVNLVGWSADSDRRLLPTHSVEDAVKRLMLFTRFWRSELSLEQKGQLLDHLSKSHKIPELDELIFGDQDFATALLAFVDPNSHMDKHVSLLYKYGDDSRVFLRVLALACVRGDFDLAEKMLLHPQNLQPALSAATIGGFLRKASPEISLPAIHIITEKRLKWSIYLVGVRLMLHLEDKNNIQYVISHAPTAKGQDLSFVEKEVTLAVFSGLAQTGRSTLCALCLEHWPLFDLAFNKVLSEVCYYELYLAFDYLVSWLFQPPLQYERLSDATCIIIGFGNSKFRDKLLTMLKASHVEELFIVEGLKTGLQVAAYEGDASAVNSVFACSHDPKAIVQGSACLHAACAEGSAELVSTFLDKGADVRLPCWHLWVRLPKGPEWEKPFLELAKSSKPPLMLAARHGHVSAVEVLLRQSAVQDLVKKQNLAWHLRLLDFFEKCVLRKRPFPFKDFERFQELIGLHVSLATFDVSNVIRLKRCEKAAEELWANITTSPPIVA